MRIGIQIKVSPIYLNRVTIRILDEQKARIRF
jgi:hypothetical protein